MTFTLVCFALSLTAGTAGTVAVLSASPRPDRRPRHAARRNPYAAPIGG